MHLFLSFLSFSLVLLISCSSPREKSDPFKDCKYGKPSAIFSAETPTVKQHQFEIKGAKAFETILFADSKQLEVVQMGCNEVEQEFLFRIPKMQDTSPEAILDMGTNLLAEMGSLSESLKPFDFWAGAIKEQQASFKKGKELELDKGIFALIDHISSGKKSLIRIVLAQRV